MSNDAGTISSKFKWKKLSPDDGHYFFGYYDRNPWDSGIANHLVMKVPQIERLPERGETAEIGLLSLDGQYSKLTETRCWCHQQGCMELFLKHRPDCFIYNDYDDEQDRVIARIFQLGKGVVGQYDRPVYAISPDGRWGASLDFSRIPRRGYSYADAVLSPDVMPKEPENDGIWLIDLHTGESKLVASYDVMMKRHPYAYSLAEQRVWLNHVIFNSDSSRLLWLFRHSPADSSKGVFWKTFMYTSSLTGEDTECILSECQWQDFISHQIWGHHPNEILVDARWSEAGHGAVVFDESRRPFTARRISESHGRMSHMVFSPDGKYILADSYPEKETSLQTLIIIDAETGKWEELGKFYHRPVPMVETRCDLHPRWSPDGRFVTVDSTHDGKRGIYILELDK